MANSLLRRTFAVSLLAFTVGMTACKDEVTPHSTQIHFVINQNCTPAGAVEMFLDGSSIGSAVAGGSITRDVDSGDHIVSASANGGGGYHWPQTTVNVLEGQTFIQTFSCTS